VTVAQTDTEVVSVFCRLSLCPGYDGSAN
jgi:hypothetical protein